MKVFIHPQIKNNFKFFGLQKSSKWVDVELAGGKKAVILSSSNGEIFFLFRKKLKGVNELLLVLYQAQEALSSFFFGSIRVMLL